MEEAGATEAVGPEEVVVDGLGVDGPVEEAEAVRPTSSKNSGAEAGPVAAEAGPVEGAEVGMVEGAEVESPTLSQRSKEVEVDGRAKK